MSIRLSSLTDGELERELKRLATSERRSTVDLVRHLAEFGARRLFLPAGFPSLYKYTVGVLGLSEQEALHRIVAARVCRRFPHILELLDSGALSLTSVKLLAPHLTPENSGDLVAEATGKTRRDLERRLAARFPEREKRSCARKLPASSPPEAAEPSGKAVTRAQPPPAAVSDLFTVPPPPALPARVAAPAWTKPVAEDRYRISFTASAATYDALQTARDLLGHAIPSGDFDAIIGRALALLVADLSRKKFAAADRPRRCRMPANLESRYIPAEIRRIVWERDGGRCAFIAADGRRCDETRCIEFHHLWPWAEGGKATAENIQLRCRAHNVYEADMFYAASRAGRHDVATRPGPSSLVGWGDVARVEGDRSGRGSGGAGRAADCAGRGGGVSTGAHAP
jgi:hypothetical protein